MKQIRAYVKPHKLADVTLALREMAGLTGLTVDNVQGFGRRGSEMEPSGRAGEVADYVPCARIEIFCRDELVEGIVSAIREKAHTGLRGDGKIYISEVRDALRIETGERGEMAV